MDRQEHLNRIKAKCEQLLALAEKRTEGRWVAQIYDDLKTAKDEGEFEWAGETTFIGAAGSVWLSSGGAQTGLPGCIETSGNDAAFIASCAGPAEAGWKATIAAIDALRDMGEHDAAILELNIITAWPEELL
jgi:hypothetical protein